VSHAGIVEKGHDHHALSRERAVFVAVDGLEDDRIACRCDGIAGVEVEDVVEVGDGGSGFGRLAFEPAPLKAVGDQRGGVAKVALEGAAVGF
jgi:hypothetical protein